MLNVGFWNSALLAREAATVDVLSDGRLELGLGAGHMKREFETAEIAWTPWNNASRDSAERRSKCVKCSPI
jgi:alkanesulfonate monooxygenase SsuD/methylene tetrahydromethanopterin reductase-like flavin-dependent oxidoreductase (luciferase family)